MMPAEERRSEKIEIRVTPLEKVEIDERALAAGAKRSDYIRRRALCQPVGSDFSPSSEEAKAEHRRSTAADIDREHVAAEVAEARLDDRAALKAFMQRRVPQLVGAGNTTPVAERKARAEWELRGT